MTNSSAPKRFEGLMDVMTPFAVRHLTHTYASTAEALAQVVDNSRDARALHVWVSCHPGKFIVVDDGDGVMPFMHAEDHDTLQKYKEDLRRGLPMDGLDIRDLVDPVSQKTFQWMEESYGCSWKAKTAEPDVTGLQGIGHQSFRSITNNGESKWYSLPSPRLVEQYYGADKTPDAIETYRLIPPTEQELRSGNTRYVLEPSPAPLTDANGRVLEHGMRVEIFGLKREYEPTARPEFLVKHFQGRYGERIKNGQIEILVIDRVTEEGKRTPGGQVLRVPPSAFPGTKILDKVGHLHGGRGPFNAQIFYDPGARGHKIELYRRGSRVNVITVVDGFNRPPWNTGKLAGFIDTPDLPDEEFPWLTDKTTPAPSEALNQWRRAIFRWEDQLVEEADQHDASIQRGRLQETVELVQDALKSTVAASPEFQGIFQGVAKPGAPVGAASNRQPKKAPTKRTPEEDIVQVTVLNEHNRGVRDIKIELRRGNRLVDAKTTGAGGKVSFGQAQAIGQHTLKMVLPANIQAVSESQHTFSITSTLGFSWVFRVKTGEPAPYRPRLPKLEIWTHAWSHTGQPWRTEQLLDRGYIEINTGADHMRQALARKDFEMVLNLTANYACMAIASVLPGDKGESFLQASNLLPEVLMAIRLLAKQRTKSSTKRR